MKQVNLTELPTKDINIPLSGKNVDTEEMMK